MATSETDPSDSIGVTASATDTTTTVGTTSTIGTTSKMTDISADIRNELRRSNKNSRRTKSAAFEKFQINSSKALRMEKCNSDKMPTRTIVRRRSTPEKKLIQQSYSAKSIYSLKLKIQKYLHSNFLLRSLSTSIAYKSEASKLTCE